MLEVLVRALRSSTGTTCPMNASSRTWSGSTRIAKANKPTDIQQHVQYNEFQILICDPYASLSRRVHTEPNWYNILTLSVAPLSRELGHCHIFINALSVGARRLTLEHARAVHARASPGSLACQK